MFEIAPGITYWYPMKPKYRIRIDQRHFAQLEHDPTYQATPKYDGLRHWIFYVDKNNIQVWNRYGDRILEVEPVVIKALSKLSIPDGTVMDGEMWHPKVKGYVKPSLSWIKKNGPFYFMMFDLIMINGEYITRFPLKTRFAKLKALLARAKGQLYLAPATTTQKRKMYEACIKEIYGEGIVCKKLDSEYYLGTKDSVLREEWIKVKRIMNEL